MSNLQITVNQAVLNKSFELIGKMENYVKIIVNNQEYRTGIVAGEKDKPIVWNETVSIPLRNAQNTVIEIQVLD